MIHGKVEMEVSPERYTAAQLADFEEQGIEVAVEEDAVELAFVELRDADGNVIPLDSEEAEGDADLGGGDLPASVFFAE